jgi:hypothetical protein
MSRTRTAILAAALAPVLAGASLFELWSRAYGPALLLLIVVVLCMELRVRMGYTLPRGLLFYVHLSSGVLLFASLGLLSYGYSASGLFAATCATYALMLITGGVLLYRTTAL